MLKQNLLIPFFKKGVGKEKSITSVTGESQSQSFQKVL